MPSQRIHLLACITSGLLITNLALADTPSSQSAASPGSNLITRAADEAPAHAETGILTTLRPGHPRLFINPASLQTLRDATPQTPAMSKQLAAICQAADKFLAEKPVEYILKGPRLLDKSRTCLDRVSTLAFAWQMTANDKYAVRALAELTAVCAFPDWHPAHFLDTAEMTCAVGIGYDWLYSFMSPAQRELVRNALITKGLMPGLAAYRGQGPSSWWPRAHNNWSQVCNGGLAVGALAIADEEPDLASQILASGLMAVEGAMLNFGPDGSWNEGPGYWGYTTQYTAYYMEALSTALGSMHELDRNPGLAATSLFKIYFVGPTGLTFSFADCGDRDTQTPQMFWLAKTFHQPLAAWEASQKPSHSPFNLLWYSSATEGPAQAGLPLHKYFRRDQIVFLRSAWEDPQSMWVGFKGGDNKANHTHLDLGSFVLDACGERWAADLGSDDYNLPGYFGKERWSYFRLRTESHNTLLINQTNQNVRAAAPIIAFSSDATGGAAVADLSAAYPMTQSTRRGLSLQSGKILLVQDEVLADKPVDILWGMMTRAKVTTEGASVVLEQNGKQLYGRILSPSGAIFQTGSANPPPPQRQQPDATRLLVKLPGNVTNVVLAVAFSTDPHFHQPVIQPLAQWAGRIENQK